MDGENVIVIDVATRTQKDKCHCSFLFVEASSESLDVNVPPGVPTETRNLKRECGGGVWELREEKSTINKEMEERGDRLTEISVLGMGGLSELFTGIQEIPQTTQIVVIVFSMTLAEDITHFGFRTWRN